MVERTCICTGQSQAEGKEGYDMALRLELDENEKNLVLLVGGMIEKVLFISIVDVERLVRQVCYLVLLLLGCVLLICWSMMLSAAAENHACDD